MNNKSFNSYQDNLDLEFLRKFCMEYGTLKIFSRGEVLESVGLASKWIGYIVKGCFNYKLHNTIQGKDYITGFAFENEFVLHLALVYIAVCSENGKMRFY